MKFFRKKRFIIPAILFAIIAATLYFASDITKNYINKNGKELLGRKIQLDGLSFNYYDISVRATNLTIMEDNDTDVFGGFREFFIDFEPWKLLSGEYKFSQVLLDSLHLNIIKRGETFNFDSLIPNDTTTVADTIQAPASEIKFLVENIKLQNSRLHFYDADVNNSIELENMSLTLPQIAWNNQESNAGIDFVFGESGMVHIGADAHMQDDTYTIDLKTKNIDIAFVRNYLLPYMHINDINGLIDMDISIKGSMRQYENIVINGNSQLADFILTDKDNTPFVKLKHADVRIDSINLATQRFTFDTIKVVEPYFYAALFKENTNIEQIFAPILEAPEDSSATETNNNEEEVYYKINKILINGGEVAFTDHTLNRPFHYSLQDINMVMNNLAADAAETDVAYSINLNNNGALDGTTTFSLQDFHKLKHKMKVAKLQLQSFSPYAEFYVGRGITEGHFSYDMSIDMSKHHLLNNNSVYIQSLNFGNKTGDSTATKLPIRFALYLLKDKDDKIAFDLPVTGNPSDPQFTLGKIIWKTVANFLVKTAASPFNALGSLAGDNPDKLKNIEFQFLQDTLAQPQKDIIDRLANIYHSKSELLLVFEQYTDAKQELELVAIEEAKRVHQSELDQQRSYTAAEQRELWTQWITSKKGDSTLSEAEICRNLVGNAKAEMLLTQKISNRNIALNSYLIEKGIDKAHIKITSADLKNITDEMKKPHFKVNIELP